MPLVVTSIHRCTSQLGEFLAVFVTTVSIIQWVETVNSVNTFSIKILPEISLTHTFVCVSIVWGKKFIEFF